MNSSMDQIFKDALSNHKSPVSENLWEAIENDLGSPQTNSSTEASLPGQSVFSAILGSAALTLAIGGLSFLVVTMHTQEAVPTPIITENTPVNTEKLTTLNSVVKESKTVISETQITTQNEVVKKSTTVNKETSTTVSKSSLSTTLEQVEEPLTSSTPSSSVVLEDLHDTQDVNNSEAVQETEEVFKAGEFVTFTINFNNTSGEDVKSFKVWEEFPDWCDVSTLETINHNSNYVVTPVKKKWQNAIEWKIKGNFSGDLTSPNNTGFIEYRIKLTENRKASELEKNQPQVN